jgi:hypothetical protein
MKLPDTSRLAFDEKKHAYKLDGRLLSGVTTVIDGTSSKQNLIGWAANMACDHIDNNRFSLIELLSREGVSGFEVNKYLNQLISEARTAHTRRKEAAGAKGTDTHALVEAYINYCLTGEGTPIQPLTFNTLDPIQPFIDWAIENVDRFLAAEQRLYSEKHGYAGTCDFVAVMDGKLTIGDLKTFPKMWSADAFIQMGAYSLAWHELTGERPEQSVVVKMCDPNDERLRKYGGKAFAAYPRYALEEDEEMFLTRLKMYRYNENFTSPKE